MIGIKVFALILALYSGSNQVVQHQVQVVRACTQDDLDTSYVTYCGPECEPLFDDLNKGDKPDDEPSSRDKVVHVVSSRDGLRFKINTYDALNTTEHYYAESRVNVSLFVDTKIKYQRILGFGTTLTDASCVNFFDLPDERRQDLLKDYFSHEFGIRLNLLHASIGSTKYSFTNYALDAPDSEHVELSAYDSDYRIPLIKEVLKTAGRAKNRIKLLASSASAPADLKTVRTLVNGGRIRQDKFNEYANYLNGWIRAYQAEGVSIWSLILSKSPASVGEDVSAKKPLNYNSMEMKPSDVIKLVEALNVTRSKLPASDYYRLMLLGDRKEYLPWWSDTLFKNQIIFNSVAGVAYTNSHDKPSQYDNLAYAILRHPKKYFIVTEGGSNSPLKLGNWQYGENYATEIVKNLEYGSVGWIDFNMALNLDGGPTVTDEYKADASIIVNSKKATYYRNPMFYAIGHLSRYVKPGSVRVKSVLNVAPQMYAVQHIAFVTPDNYLVVFIANNNIGPMAIEVGYDTRTRAQVLLDTKSFNTFIMRL